MLAIDTNVVVRFLVGDEPDQARRAFALIETEEVMVATTVLMESEWVLRASYGLKASDALDALAGFAGLPSVRLQEPERVARAMVWAREGMGFADALHLAAADGCDAFMSFDRRLLKRASGTDARPVREP